MYQQHMLLKIRKTILKFTLINYHIHASFIHLKLPISIKIPVIISPIVLFAFDSYISHLDFMNYLLANLVAKWL